MSDQASCLQNEVIGAWTQYLSTITHWQDLIKDVTPRVLGCGKVYEIANPIDRPNEGFALVDMRGISFSQPHYHLNDETEIYMVLQGSGIVVVAGKELEIKPGVVVVTSPYEAHYTVQADDLVLAVINTPPFNPANSVDIAQSNVAVGFDEHQFARLKNVDGVFTLPTVQ